MDDTIKTGIDQSTLIEVKGIKVGVAKYYYSAKNKDLAGEFTYSPVVMSKTEPEKAIVFIPNGDGFSETTPEVLRALATEIEKFSEANKAQIKHLEDIKAAKKAEREAYRAKLDANKATNLAVAIDLAKSDYTTLKKHILAGVVLPKGKQATFEKAVLLLSQHCPEFLASC